jgi:hypothetical protein
MEKGRWIQRPFFGDGHGLALSSKTRGRFQTKKKGLIALRTISPKQEESK